MLHLRAVREVRVMVVLVVLVVVVLLRAALVQVLGPAGLVAMTVLVIGALEGAVDLVAVAVAAALIWALAAAAAALALQVSFTLLRPTVVPLLGVAAMVLYCSPTQPHRQW